jgi:hypothetical protein
MPPPGSIGHGEMFSDSSECRGVHGQDRGIFHGGAEIFPVATNRSHADA